MNIKKFLNKATAVVASVAFTALMVVPLVPVNAASMTGVEDSMTRQQISVASEHTITFTVPGTLATTSEIELQIPTDFGFGSATAADFNTTSAGTAVFDNAGATFNSTTGLYTVGVSTAGGAGETVTIAITGTNVTNPATAGTFTFSLTHTDGTSTIDNGSFSVPILDDDTVNVTGFIQDLITFDIDTTSDVSAATGTDCDAATGTTPCDGHSNPAAGGQFDASGYTVSLGNLITTDYNASGDTVVHEDGNTGQINTIGFDLTANVSGGANVTVESLNGALDNAGNQISSTTVGSTIDLSAGPGYGLQLRDSAATTGAVTAATGFNAGGALFGGVETTQNELFNTGSAAIEGARVLFDVGARPDASNTNGTFTDELTFIATATF